MFKRYDSLQRQLRRMIYFDFAEKNPGSVVAVWALQQSIPGRVDTASVYLDLLNKLDPSIREWHSVKRLKQMLEANQRTEVGRILPDFRQMDQAGKQVSFSSFKGKYVLVELWASWCMPCRKKNPGLVRIQEKYGQKNFSILGVALEEKNDRDKWLTAIKKDGLTWPQLTDFKGWKNEVAVQFGVQSIPFNVLVDPQGKIIARNIYDEELDNLLAGVLR